MAALIYLYVTAIWLTGGSALVLAGAQLTWGAIDRRAARRGR